MNVSTLNMSINIRIIILLFCSLKIFVNIYGHKGSVFPSYLAYAFYYL